MYYEALGPIYFQDVFLGLDRESSELNKKRFKGPVKNLGSFIEMLAEMMPKDRQAVGIDLGCGAHFFTNYTRERYGWGTIGFDQWEEAIEYARLKYPQSAEAYQVCDFLNGIPFRDATMDFVFSNLVIQHFEDIELYEAFSEVSRVLRAGGVFSVIFKRWVNWEEFTRTTGLKANILDHYLGIVEIEEPMLKKAINSANYEIIEKLSSSQREGMREFRWYKNRQVLECGQKYALRPVALIEFNSGRGLPATGIMFVKE